VRTAGVTGRTITFYAEAVEAKHFVERLANNQLHRVFLKEFETEKGERIVNLKLAYRVWGKPNAERDNILLIFHALTGDANCAGYTGPDGRVAGWWEALFGRHAAIDLAQWCVICANHPGSCYGSSGPTDREVGATRPIGRDFPEFSPRDLACAHKQLLDLLEIPSVHAVLGGSLGGMAALEWAVLFPGAAKRAVVLAAPAASSAQAIAFNHIQAKCFEIDPAFKNGDYYGGPRPMLALSLARQIATITYRSPGEFHSRFGRDTAFSPQPDAQAYLIQRYLDYQGEKLVRRFDPNSYLKLLATLDRHDLARGRGSLAEVLKAIRAQMCLISIDSDILYTGEEVESLYRAMAEAGVAAQYKQIASLHGHDGFLIESDQLNPLVGKFLET